jgi:NACHT conflict system protein/AAA domain-containing protein
VAVSPFTFAGALRLLDPDRSAATALDKVFGGLIFAGAATAVVAGGPGAWLSAAAVLALVDPKNEATKLFGPLVTRTVNKLKGIPNDAQHDLIVAAHTVTVLSAYFDALKDVLGPVYGQLELTDKDLRRLAGGQAAGPDPIDDLVSFKVRLPSVQHGLTENLEQNLLPYFHRLADQCLLFFEGLEAWQQAQFRHQDRLGGQIVERARTRYLDRMLTLGSQPPFALWLTLNEHTATRSAMREYGEGTAVALAELRSMLSIALTGTSPAKHSLRDLLARTATAVLDEPLLRSGLRTLASPSVRAGFVEPAFKLAIHDGLSEVSDEEWWSSQPTCESLVGYLAGYLADESSTKLPLFLLGHPGAGKSLLTEVLAAQLPTESFSVVRIPLRRVNTDDDLTEQITKELRRVLQKPTTDIEKLRAECENCRLVILLDGFDELVQATGVTQSSYLTKIATFQKNARTLGVPTSVVVTSRVLVADQVEIPPGTPMIKLCEFDDARIAQWVTAWNAAHLDSGGFQPLEPAVLTAQAGVAELARQPLLLLVLAVYLAELHTSLPGGSDLTQAVLYRRILDHFIKRQVTEKTEPDASPEVQQRLELLQRKQLQFAAIGMFNRRRQHITGEELDEDLAALAAVSEQAIDAPRSSQSVLGEFMFVHNAKADQEQRNAYEFLHATFGEYLVAELILALLIRPTADLLRRVLAHQPLSSRQPVLDFLIELADLAEPSDRSAFLSAISDLLIAARVQPDTADDFYQPLEYDPVRRRAAYTANLTLLRVLLDKNPVSIEALVGNPYTDQWERLVRLWRAGLDRAGWVSVIERLGSIDEGESYFPADHKLVPRITPRSSAVGEAELIADHTTMAIHVAADHAGIDPGDYWTDGHLAILSEISQILYTNTGTPHFRSMLPFDLEWYSTLLELTGRYALNDNLKRVLLVLLSRAAGQLPYEYVEKLLVRTLPAPDDNHTVEIGAIVAAHPRLLRAYPAIANILLDNPVYDDLALIAILWRALPHSDSSDRPALDGILSKISTSAAAQSADFAPGYFAPEFFTYLRNEQPQHWLVMPTTLSRFALIPNHLLARVEPEDALWAAETWDTGYATFATNYLLGRKVEVDLTEDPLLQLRAYMAEIQEDQARR